MKAVHERKLEMASQVLGFFRVNPPSDSQYAGIVARLQEHLDRAETLVGRQRAGILTEHTAALHRRELRRRLQFELLGYLSRVGGAAAKVQPLLADQFKLPPLKAPTSTFVNATRAMIEKAEAEKAVLAEVGLSDAALTALKEELAELEGTVTTGYTAHTDHVGASKALAGVTADVLSLVGILDGLTHHCYRHNGELLAEWNHVSHVRAAPRRQNGGPET